MAETPVDLDGALALLNDSVKVVTKNLAAHKECGFDDKACQRERTGTLCRSLRTTASTMRTLQQIFGQATLSFGKAETHCRNLLDIIDDTSLTTPRSSYIHETGLMLEQMQNGMAAARERIAELTVP